MITCPKCKNELPDDIELCGYCGYTFKEPTKDDILEASAPTPSFEGVTALNSDACM